MIVRGLAALTFSLLATSALAQTPAAKPDDKKWDVTKPPLKLRTVPISTDEGTWMNLDVSPDGRTIAFDLLGDIYTIPMSGGQATRIADGLAYEVQPRFSPDGSQIAFTSDRGGGDNIWIMNRDGSGKRQLTKETFTLLNNPAWTPDGRYIAARKHFTTARSLGTGEIWLYHVSGGSGVALVERPNPQHQKELGEPVFSPDGKTLYFSWDATPGGTFQYAQDSNGEIFRIDRIDVKSGERSTVTGGPGGAVRPTPSPDGKYLAYVHRERARSKLYVRNLATGEARKIYDDLDQDVQETWAVTGVYPNMDWTPDSRSIVFWAGGKIRRINLDGSGATDIPFSVSDTRDVSTPPRPQIAAWQESFTTKMPRFASLSPDGRRVVFESMGRLYVKDAAGGEARALTADDGDFQLFPSWSRDGKRIAFVSWNDVRQGEIRTVSASGGGMTRVTRIAGQYRKPAFSPDGRFIAYEAANGGGITSPLHSGNPGAYLIPAAGGEARRLSASGANPHFGADGTRVFMEVTEDRKRKLISTDLSGQDKRVHAQGELVTGFDVSPAGDLFAFRENYNIFVMPLPPGGKPIETSMKDGAVPATRISRDGGSYMHWSGNGRALGWSMGPTLYHASADALIGAGYQAPASGISLATTRRADAPAGRVVITGARILTMANADGGAIDDGVIILNGNRIEAVGRRGEIAIPSGAKTVDAAGKTIIPGLIDAHAHGPQADDDLIPQQNWQAMAHLAFGVTTVHDPSSSASEIFAASEMQRAGLILAPRLFSSGEIVYGAKSPGSYAAIDSYEDALSHIRRLKAQGAHSVKNYNQPRRDQRQQVVAAAVAENILVVPEGGSLYSQDVTLIQDGNSTIEHNLPQAMLYKDIIDLFGQSGVGYTPTLGVTFGGMGGEPYWLQESDVWKHPILSRHAPREVLEAEMVRRVKAPDEDYADKKSAATAHLLLKRGVPVSAGGHGQQQGLALHWDIWSFARGGFTPIEALATATSTPAKVLGFTDLGTLEAGKLADLIILDADPSENVRNTEKISKVMLNGRLYDALTLNEEVTGNRTRKPYYWER